MKAIRFLVLSLITGCLAISLSGQVKPVIRGEKVPDVDLGHIWNEGGKQYEFDDLQGQVVILDFWFTACSACVAGFPKMKKLQETFKDQVKIFLVTFDGDQKVEKLLKKMDLDLTGVTVISQDTLLNQLFPHYTYPYNVWIDKQGIFRYGTFDFNTTENNIKRFLSGKEMNFGEVKFAQGETKANSLLSIAGNYPQFIKNYSILLKGQYEYFQHGPVVTDIDSATGLPYRFRALGISPLSLLKCAFNYEVTGFQPSLTTVVSNARLVLEVKNSSKLYYPSEEDKVDDWMRENELFYELQVSPKEKGSMSEYMKKDLNDAFPIYGSVEVRPARHLSLIRIDNIDHLKSNSRNAITTKKGYLSWVGINTDYLINYLNQTYSLNARPGTSHLPVINETGITYNIDLELPISDISNLPRLRLFLQGKGLDLVEKSDPIPMLIVRDRP